MDNISSQKFKSRDSIRSVAGGCLRNTHGMESLSVKNKHMPPVSDWRFLTSVFSKLLIVAVVILLSGCTIGGINPASSPSTATTTTPSEIDPAKSIQNFICSSSFKSAGLWDWVPYSAVAIIVSAVLLTFIYIFSMFFRNQNLTGYVKLEIFELIATTIIVFGFLAAVVPSCSITLGTFISNISDPAVSQYGFYDVTELYFIEIKGKIEGWTHLNYILNLYIDQLASITPYSRPLGVGIVATPTAGFAAPLKQMIYNVFTSLSIAAIINLAQLYVIKFSIAAFLKYYLPIGIFLRSFTPTRRFGGTLIALAIGFVFIYPLLIGATYLLVMHGNDSIVNTYDNGLKNYWDFTLFGETYSNAVAQNPDAAQDPALQQEAVKHTKENYSNLSDAAFNLFKTSARLFDILGNIFSHLLGFALTSAFLIPMSSVGMAVVLGYLLPAVHVVLFVQSVKYLSKTIGEEIDVTSLTRMI